ncbi:ferrochelatase [Pedobacter montanisoli]|uniref:Ferrochelatase n=1 Tax=Pedobacter montanisoli TaxID=2923277 RepID=A0ABS9ZW16_9SPHI|nr:ferrochelatase [Pedobacter montanisoli]MCJ0742496.1 ferrochelatase [Pedobacter montanisoli]
MTKKGVLLVNLGTPDSPSVKDVRKYLDEFLMDGRVIDIPKFNRALLVKGIITTFRGPKSAKLYEAIWTEQGSPLMIYSLEQAQLLQQSLGDEYHVELAMRYQSPSIKQGLENLKAKQVDRITVIPLFPQYASATTGSVIEKVMDEVKRWQTIPPISFINSFHDNDKMIQVFAENAISQNYKQFDHYLFSYHGVPERQLLKADDTGKHCLQRPDCCDQLTAINKFCYKAQCYDTSKKIAAYLDIKTENYTVCFQSRLGKAEWAKPYSSEVLKDLAAKGIKKVLVFSPAFVADCLETIHEIGVEYDHDFKALGGEKVQLVESLNSHPLFIEALADLTR